MQKIWQRQQGKSSGSSKAEQRQLWWQQRRQIQLIFVVFFMWDFCWIFHMGFLLGWIQFLLILVWLWDEFFFEFGLIMSWVF